MKEAGARRSARRRLPNARSRRLLRIVSPELGHQCTVATKRLLDELARTHYDRLFRAALFMCNDADTAEDLVQETFLAAATSLESFEGRSSFYTWLYGILLNKFRAWLRRKGRAIALDEMVSDTEDGSLADLLADDRPDAPEQMTQRETAALVREALDELPAHHRSVLVLRYLETMSYQDVADALGCSLGTVKSRIHYALQKVAGKLRRHQDIIP